MELLHRCDTPSVLVLSVKCLVIVVIWRALAIGTRVIGIQRSGCPIRAVRSSQPTDGTDCDVPFVHF
ncbi:Uncharacterized protein DBV15_05044 [Temnothorax longispinosus]|uniref:Uncharacterized protein n=1 Tax=Temnothorax longispinosus TaxID=300112 RepID=A0A4S2KQH4_9HYME|nr:Uncharacterized protein DBV15_05044 [Temnothorax longispinosus]